MDIDKTQILKSKLEKIKNATEVDSESTVDKYKGLFAIGSYFTKSTLFWLTLNQLNAKFPTYFVEFGYWETFLFTVSLTSFVSIFKTKK
jgi:hypothetical protein